MQKRNIPAWMVLALILISMCLLSACTVDLKPAVERASTPRPAVVEKAPQGISVGMTAPDFSLATPRGTPITLSQYRGQPVIVTFFATWCGPCKQDMPGLQAVYLRYWEDGLAIVAVNLREEPRLVTHFGSEMNLTFPLALDRNGRVGSTYRVQSIPRSFFIDSNGVIRKVAIGYMDEERIASSVEGLFQYAYNAPKEPPAEQPQQSPAEEPTTGPAETVKLDGPAAQAVKGCVNVGSALVRSGPGKNFKAKYALEIGKCTAFDAESPDGAWLRLAQSGSDGSRLWMAAKFVTLDGDEGLLAVVE